jgi:hypothetical protein
MAVQLHGACGFFSLIWLLDIARKNVFQIIKPCVAVAVVAVMLLQEKTSAIRPVKECKK